MPANNNAYITVKLAQLDAREKQLKAELKQLAERRKAYAVQKVDEPTTADKSQSDPTG